MTLLSAVFSEWYVIREERGGGPPGPYRAVKDDAQEVRVGLKEPFVKSRGTRRDAPSEE